MAKINILAIFKWSKECVFAKKWSKMAKKQTKYFGTFSVISVIFSGFRKWLTFGISVSVENVPNYSVFYFRDRRYIFAKLLKNPKLLPKRMALLNSSQGNQGFLRFFINRRLNRVSCLQRTAGEPIVTQQAPMTFRYNGTYLVN